MNELLSCVQNTTVRAGTADEVISVMAQRFTSGNQIPVERAYIKREEWDALFAYINELINDDEDPAEQAPQSPRSQRGKLHIVAEQFGAATEPMTIPVSVLRSIANWILEAGHAPPPNDDLSEAIADFFRFGTPPLGRLHVRIPKDWNSAQGDLIQLQAAFDQLTAAQRAAVTKIPGLTPEEEAERDWQHAERVFGGSPVEKSGDCIACSVGNPGVYVKDGVMVCPHRPAPETMAQEELRRHRERMCSDETNGSQE